MKRKKVLYVITQAEMGGAQRYLYDLATSSDAQNYDISVAIGQGQDQSLINELKGKNIITYQIKHLVRQVSPLNDILAIFELRKIYKRIKPDVIHLNSSKAGVLGSLANHTIAKISYNIVYTAHGWVFNEPMNKIKKILYWSLEKITSQPKDKIICVSEFDRQTAIKYKIAGAKKLTTIHNGLDNNLMVFLTKEEARKELKLPTDKTIVGTVANFYKTKGLEYFIKAIKELNDENIIGVIIGEGDLRMELKKLISSLGLKNKLLLLGKHTNASKYLKAFDIYACSSVKEGFPYSILEAMAAKLPIISTNVGGIPEMIKDNNNGLLVEPKNPEILSEEIKLLIKNQDLSQKLAEKAEQDVKNNFTKEQMIKQTFGLY